MKKISKNNFYKNEIVKKSFKILIIIIIVFSALNYIYIKHEENILNKEFKILTKKDFEKDNYDTPIVTIGNYEEVEKSIKLYLTDYSNKYKTVSKLINDDKIKTILSAENYLNDEPSFVNSKKYVDNYKEKFNNEINDLMTLNSKKKINSYINDKHLNIYYKNLYKKLMYSPNMQKELNSSNDYLKIANDNVNNLLETEYNVISFLANCKSWSVRKNQIIFTSGEDLNTYNSLIERIK